MQCFSLQSTLSVSLLALACVSCAPATSRQSGPATGTVTAADLERHPGEPIERVLERKVPGVAVIRTADGGIALRIRGNATLGGGVAWPLYVVNDLPVSARHDGAVPGITPEDIASIRVLKGTEAVIYGIEGANGVVLIRTKQGRRY